MARPLRTLIVDDEAPARARLARALDSRAAVEVIGEAADGETALKTIETLRPDLVFLDIQMPRLSGIDVLRLLDIEPRPKVVFVTAYDEHAVDAFELAALDYLLKPWSEERLDMSLARAAEPGQHPPEPAQLEALATPGERIPVRFLDQVHLLDINDISHCTSEHRVIRVYNNAGERYWTPETLDSLSRRLGEQHFFRCHRSTLVRLAAIERVTPAADGRLQVTLTGGFEITAARDPARALKQRLGIA